MTRNNERLIGLDLLRIFSMFGIIGLHIINQGGLISNANIYSSNYYIILLLLIVSFTSVDVFGILTGYLSVTKEKNNYNRIIELILVTIFYCIIIPTIYYFFHKNEFGLNLDVIYNYVPVLKGNYWYLTNYVLLYFMIPYINKLCKSLSRDNYKRLLIILFVFLSLVPNILLETVDLFKIDFGYSATWLVFCYMLGGYIRLFTINVKGLIKKIVLLIIISFIVNCLIRNLSYILFGKVVKGYFMIDYISPFTIILSIFMVLMFIKIRITNTSIKRLILYFSSSSFSVYIIHCHRVIFYNYLDSAFVGLLRYNSITLLFLIVLSIVFIYLICTLLDEIRKLLFKLLKINILINNIGDKISLFLKC